mmetsp:Transcript_11071/g.16261  ORF Transcript_11071/g.16261 Transcript_11071/m.16261 type:complete len:1316 (-) Transcript_11071:26-3973(-)
MKRPKCTKDEIEDQQSPFLKRKPSKRASFDDHDGHHHRVMPLVERSPLMRLDVFPFLGFYTLLIALDYQEHFFFQSLFWNYFRTFALPVALIGHLVLILLQQWRVKVCCWVGYSYAQASAGKEAELWTHCLVEEPSLGETTIDAGIVPVRYHQHKLGDGTFQSIATVVFHDICFRFSGKKDEEMDGLWYVDKASGTDIDTLRSSQQDLPQYEDALFHRLRYPVHLPTSVYYTKWGKGHSSLNTVKRSYEVYGKNETQVQLPTFKELLGPQLLAPFFLFQLFCVVLWSLDEYWYYAIFTLFALLLFESTVAFNRLKNLERLRGTLRHAYPILAYRHEEWIYLKTDELVPGDIVSLNSLNKSQGGDKLHVPADLLLLKGAAVVDEALLTGESIPQRKSALDASSTNDEKLDLQDHKNSILFSGTVLVSHDIGLDNGEDGNKGKHSYPKTNFSPPDDGIVCFVLKTGFETAQGSLLRTMAHSSKKSTDGIHTQDTFVFVAILLVCAILSAASVLQQGWGDSTRNRFRLVLHVIIIVTSVVPPELPMELSLAVTNSVADLMRRCHVFCTEPFRIPWAGQVTVCCFDKTGTLTSDYMQLKGVRLLQGNNGNSDSLKHPLETDLPWETLRVMVGCHSLTLKSYGGELLGDPLELAVLQDTGFVLQGNNQLLVPKDEPKDGYPKGLLIHHRFTFSSRLKRMTVLVTEGGSKDVYGVVKGAPETIRDFLKNVPTHYDQVYRHHMKLGHRVLAMAYRKLGSSAHLNVFKEGGREAIEKDLIFVGFLILECPLKPDSKNVIADLKKTGHEPVMITGDASLTAAEVARQVGIIAANKTYELQCRADYENNTDASILSNFEFVPLGTLESDKLQSIPLSKSNLAIIRKMKEQSEGSFCVSGAVMAKLGSLALQKVSIHTSTMDSATEDKNILLHPVVQNILKELVQLISVYARHAPRQKEAVIAAYNLVGEYTMMTGDGTNDVGALKRAHVGISIISAPELEAKHRAATATISKEYKKERKARKEGKLKKKKKNRRLEDSLRHLQEAQNELDHVELGDASVASPFTSRSMSIKCVVDVLQQGRCTLVTMLTIYKILGVNCLVNALVLTKLHMHGVKQGDRQLTILGIVVAGLFFFVTRGKPLATLSPTRPPASVMCSQALLSIAGQFAIHFAFIMIATDVSLSFVDPFDPSMIPDASFNPNVLNSCTFLLTMTATVNTFVVNYRGKPFMQDLRDNTLLCRSCQVCYIVLFACSLEVFPPLNDLFQLTTFPETKVDLASDDDWIVAISQAGGLTNFVREVGFPGTMTILMAADTVMALVVNKIVTKFF